MLDKRLIELYPFFFELEDNHRNRIIEDGLKWIRLLDKNELNRLIYMNDISLKNAATPLSIQNKKFESIRHIGFSISIYLLERYMQLFTDKSDLQKVRVMNESQIKNIGSSYNALVAFSADLFGSGEFSESLKRIRLKVETNLQEEEKKCTGKIAKKSKKSKRKK